MREILFRGKQENGEWIYGHLSSDRTISTLSPLGNLDEIVIDESTISQYAGLKDKNGTRIFEHDIVKYKLDEDYPEYIGIIKFGNTTIRDYKVYNGWHVELQSTSYYKRIELTCSEYFEVIGNIYDNPELLKEE